MGHFSVPATLTGPTGRAETLDLLVDTGATFLVVPQRLAERLELVVQRMQTVQVAGGRREDWPIAEIRVGVEDRAAPTVCFIAPEGPALLGAVALESLLLAVDPVAKRLVPVDGLAMAGAAAGSSSRSS